MLPAHFLRAFFVGCSGVRRSFHVDRFFRASAVVRELFVGSFFISCASFVRTGVIRWVIVWFRISWESFVGLYSSALLCANSLVVS